MREHPSSRATWVVLPATRAISRDFRAAQAKVLELGDVPEVPRRRDRQPRRAGGEARDGPRHEAPVPPRERPWMGSAAASDWASTFLFFIESDAVFCAKIDGGFQD